MSLSAAPLPGGSCWPAPSVCTTARAAWALALALPLRSLLAAVLSAGLVRAMVIASDFDSTWMPAHSEQQQRSGGRLSSGDAHAW